MFAGLFLGIAGVTNESSNNHRASSRKLGIATSHVLQYLWFSFVMFSIISIQFMFIASYAVYTVITRKMYLGAASYGAYTVITCKIGFAMDF